MRYIHEKERDRHRERKKEIKRHVKHLENGRQKEMQ